MSMEESESFERVKRAWLESVRAGQTNVKVSLFQCQPLTSININMMSHKEGTTTGCGSLKIFPSCMTGRQSLVAISQSPNLDETSVSSVTRLQGASCVNHVLKYYPKLPHLMLLYLVHVKMTTL